MLKANSTVRKILNNCVTCRKVQGKAMSQVMGDLPPERIIGDSPAFTNIGVDFFGPFNVVNGRKHNKRYGVVFSCMSSRAIHLEMAYDLTIDSFINTLRRFISRRGNVSSITSDNATNFVGSDKELKNSIDSFNCHHVKDFLLQNNIQWNFNPPYGSHFGGFYEREIRSVRKILNSILCSQPIKLNDENLLTLLCEIESILNNRPLTELSSDPTDCVALTPNNLVLFNAGITYPPGLFTPSDSYCKRRWRQVQYLVELFWSRWRKEYLHLLQNRQKWIEKRKNLKVGDLVLVVDVTLPRNMWPLGRITSVNTDQSNFVRSAKVKMYKGKGFSCNEFDRPITKLVPLIDFE